MWSRTTTCNRNPRVLDTSQILFELPGCHTAAMQHKPTLFISFGKSARFTSLLWTPKWSLRPARMYPVLDIFAATVSAGR